MAIYYVAPTGLDNQPGTLDRPFGSLQHAHDIARPGDTIQLRGGTYDISESIRLTNDGASGQPITVTNFAGEVPVLDGSAMSEADYVLDLSSVSWNKISGIEITDGAEGGLIIQGASHNNVIERLDVHDNGRLSEYEGKGISLFGSSSNNLLLNNDSYNNRDLNLDNADGFQVSVTGAGNVLRGNRAFGNSDDGYDFFNIDNGTKGASLVIEGNWAFGNGYIDGTTPAGDGNGFKLGGARPGSGSTSGGHTVSNNVAWGNSAIGFDENQASKPSVLNNNTAYDNGTYNFGFWEQSNTFQNNLAFGEGRIAASGSTTGNSWTLGVSLAAGDFLSLDDTVAQGARPADGSLPASPFLQLAPSSDLIDKGINLGRAFAGAAPDLGAFETGLAAAAATPTAPVAPAAPQVPATGSAPAAAPAPTSRGGDDAASNRGSAATRSADTSDDTPLVDDQFYFASNPDVRQARVDPDIHYATFGRHEGRDPNRAFDTSGYLEAYPDVAAAGVNPLTHYDQFGRHEGRDPSKSFDTTAYRAAYGDVATSDIDPLTHYLQFGSGEGRSACGDGTFGTSHGG